MPELRSPRPVYLPRLLSKYGFCSRKEAERLVIDGRVAVNGVTRRNVLFEVRPGRDRVTVDGAAIAPAAPIVVKMHKPVGVVTTMKDERGRASVKDLLPPDLAGVMPMGRLDRDTSGLLLLGNDHDLANLVVGDRSRVEKLYRVTVAGALDDSRLAPLRRGITLDGERCRPARVRVQRVVDGAVVVEVVLVEGKNRQIRRSFAALGLEVVQLERLAVGPVALGDLAPGEVCRLAAAELAALRLAAAAERGRDRE